MAAKLLPVLFLSHGGGPCFFMDTKPGDMFHNLGKTSKAADFYRNLGKTLQSTTDTKGVLVISAHWIEGGSGPTLLTTSFGPKESTLLYDYYGFPDYTYDLESDGFRIDTSPTLTQTIETQLKKENIPFSRDSKRKFDHGVFIPLKLMYPNLQNMSLPVSQLSINQNMSKEYHLKLGRSLAALRAQGILIIGSGSLTHNLRGFFNSKPGGSAWAVPFEKKVDSIVLSDSPPEQKLVEAANIEKDLPAGIYRQAHPEDDHFMPFFVALGASMENPFKDQAKIGANGELLSHVSKGKKIFELLNTDNGFSISSYRFD